ncbi:MAG: RNA polymerase sigma factor [uncultured bacterium]|nr:MAG: RNA polymerase sigma factor [uncultured bacterium]
MNNNLNTTKNNKNGIFVEALQLAISNLPERSRKVIWERYGVDGAGVKTLEEIGGKFGITRERVRQIIREVCKKIKAKSKDAVLSEVSKKIIFTLEQNSGIMKEESLLGELSGSNEKQKGAAKFFVECLDDVISYEIKGTMDKACVLSGFDVEFWEGLKNEIVAILKAKKFPASEEELFEEFSKKKIGTNVSKDKMFAYLSVSLEVKKNIFGKWGISKSSEITPKGTRDKAYLVLKESGKPMHFKDIAKKIDSYGLNKRKTHPQTVHNELIKDEKFVLVGRGIYALSQWGYKKGTVKDVLEEVLRGKIKGMEKDEVIKEVLKVRQVKQSTVIINLNNYFKKTKEGKYIAK